MAIGWTKEKSSDGVLEFVAEVELSHPDALAAVAVAALREVFGVTHPAFLAGDVSIGDDPDLPHARSRDVAVASLAVVPAGLDNLDGLIDEALTPVVGSVPQRDGDGDVAVISGTTVVFVRTLPSAAAIRIWAEVTVEVSDLERARFEVEVLNRDHPFVKFVLVGDRIVAQLHLPASPFVPDHLREAFTLLYTLADEVDDDLAVRVGGRRFLEPRHAEARDIPHGAAEKSEDDGDELAMMTLLHLDADRPGSLTPAMAAQICGQDRGRLLRLIRADEEQEIEWLTACNKARPDGDSEELAVCEHELAHAERSVKLLRKALRYVIDREMHDASG